MRPRTVASPVLTLLAGLVCAGSALAQLADADPDWKEVDTPPPPAFNVAKLLPFDIGTGTNLQFGVDPATISIGKDGIVRYVVVARSASTGAVNAMYEGLRCANGEYKTYARHNPSGGWSRVENPEWKSLWAVQPSRHTLAFARQGGCEGRTAPLTVDKIVRNLKNQDMEKLR